MYCGTINMLFQLKAGTDEAESSQNKDTEQFAKNSERLCPKCAVAVSDHFCKNLSIV